ncbi:hypothetical protein KUCAC02_029346 [Chaenocephalus aceratus]|uniref:Uncharacterized protein n=1 Tax=Chaenocephalus aceratus TaxID=36190 RepID=A0ACB9X4R3_CHAAC|nr:hypothetical protein KUCAC02_029346 [Chaenocephalus aceratus]
MAANLRKYKFKKRPEQSPAQGTPANRNGAPPVRTEATGMTAEKIKADVLSSLRGDLANMLQEEVKNALAKEFGLLKSELQAVRSEITTNTIAIRPEMDQMKGDIKDVGEGLSTWSDEVNSLQTVLTTLKSQVKELQEKSEDMEEKQEERNQLTSKQGISYRERKYAGLYKLGQIRSVKVDSVGELYFFSPVSSQGGRHSATGSSASRAAPVPAPFHSNRTSAYIIQPAISLEWIAYHRAKPLGCTLTNRYVY